MLGRAAAALAIFLVIASAVPIAVTTNAASLPPVYVQVRVIATYGSWYPIDMGTSGVISMIQAFRAAVGGRPITVFSAVQGPQLSNEILKYQTENINTFLSDLKSAAGGDIIPTLNLNYYTGGTGVTTHGYCDPHNSTNCGPRFFWEVSSELLSLAAVQQGSKAVYLDAWQQFVRDVANTTVVKQVLAGLKAQGWNYLITKTASSTAYFPDYGYASAAGITVLCQTTSPYCLESSGTVNKAWTVDSSTLKAVYGLFDFQIQAKTPLNLFLGTLTTKQKALALTSLASSQATGQYTFVYPLILGTKVNGAPYYWDTSKVLQANGQTFMTLEETLASTY